MQKSRFLAAGVLVLLAFGAGGEIEGAGAAVAAAGTSTGPRTAVAVADTELNRRAQEAAAIVQAALDHTADPTYGGVYISEDNRLQLNVVGNPSAAVSLAVAAVSGVPVDLRRVTHAYSALVSLTQRLNSDEEYLAAANVDATTWGPDIRGNQVVLHLRQYSAAIAQQVTNRYANTPLVVSDQSVDPRSASRSNDFAPWNGASNIKGDGDCTSGFGVKSSSGTEYMLTAAHCGYTYDMVYNQGVTGSFEVLGRARAFMWGGASADAIIIRTPAGVSPLIFSDPTSTTRTVTSTATSDPVGGLICTGGAVSKEVCRVEIDATGQTVRYDNHIVYNLVKAHQADAVPVFARGNSGGPVYTSIGSSGAQARGIVSAFQYVDGIARYNLGWYSSMRYITPELGVTVKTP